MSDGLEVVIKVARLHERKTLADRLHHAVLDAVVDHLHEVTAARTTGVQQAALARHVIEHGLHILICATIAADHEAGAVASTGLAARRARIHKADTVGSSLLGMRHGIVIVGVAAVDHDIALIEHLEQLGEHRIGNGTGGDHGPYNTGSAERRNQARHGVDRLDIFGLDCGAGGLALTMGPHFQRVFGMESVAQAVELAALNASRLEEPAEYRFECADAARLERVFRQRGVPDLLVTDPPRAGMDEHTVQALLKHRPPRLVLVSCNPATLARDLSLLAPSYRIRAVQPVDLFPQTPHVETVAALELS